jgi:hypothetical protein
MDSRLVVSKTELGQGEGHLATKRPTARTGPDDGSPSLTAFTDYDRIAGHSYKESARPLVVI